METKKQMIIDYINYICKLINEQYPGAINEEQNQKAITMFIDSPDDLTIIKAKINELAQQVVKNYLKRYERLTNPDFIKENHKVIYDQLEILIKKLNEKNVDYQLAGALCAYIKYGEESKRVHEDIDISLNEEDISKFREVCEEMGLQFSDKRFNSPRVLKNGIPSGEHEVIATLDGSDFHIGVFCFQRINGIVINKGYYHNEDGDIYTRNEIMPLELAKEVFGREIVNYRGQTLIITPPEYIYKLKSYTKKDKDKMDLAFMENKIDKAKLARLSLLKPTIEHVKVELPADLNITELPKISR